MEFFIEIIQNKILIISGVAWFIAGFLKVIIELYIYKQLRVKRIMGSGGMPSSHTATVIALVISVAYYETASSVAFAISVIFAIIVIHDAVGVRLETGKQAKVLNAMMFESDAFQDLGFEKKLKEYIGHTPLQVLVGGIVGILVAVFMINFVYV